jgi:MSHA pilin protein MshA
LKGEFMKQSQRGFTLIELVMVIVILGVLAAVALPKFVDLSGDAKKAATSGVAGGLSSAASINYAGCSVTANVVTANKCVKVSKCSDVGALLNPPQTYAVSATGTAGTYTIPADTAATTNGTTVSCTLNYDLVTAGFTASYSAIGAGN